MATFVLRSIRAALRSQLKGRIVVATTVASRSRSDGSGADCTQTANGVLKKYKGDTYPVTDLDPTPVHWELVDDLPSSPYIDYKGLIQNNRAPGLFPPPTDLYNVSATKLYSLPLGEGWGGELDEGLQLELRLSKTRSTQTH